MYLLLNIIWLLHPFYVSVTEINHNAAEKSLEISVRIFMDDFENALRERHPNKKVDLINPPAGGAMDSLIKNYLLEKMAFEVNGQKKKPAYIGFERVDESVWAYLEITGVSELKTLKIHNPVLYEYKQEQINMVHVIKGKDRQSRKLDNPDADWEFRF
jgi:hypothetical protein